MAVSKADSDKRAIPTLVKDRALVEERRRVIVEAAVGLFVRKGFHAATTREIARAAGISVGALYEYVASKEDVLYLVCQAIHSEMDTRLSEASDEGESATERLRSAIANYVRVCDRMQDSIVLIYRETATLPEDQARYVLEDEARISQRFQTILEAGRREGRFSFRNDKSVELMAHNIVVLGHMWAFRRWFLHGHFTLDEYIEQQASLILTELVGTENRDQPKSIQEELS